MSATCIAPSRRSSRCQNVALFGAYCRYHVPVGRLERTVCRYKNCHGQPQLLSDYCARHKDFEIWGAFDKSEDISTVEFKKAGFMAHFDSFVGWLKAGGR